jgi:hypothetical protein
MRDSSGEHIEDLEKLMALRERLGVKPNIIWRRRHADFPKPIVRLAAGPLWWAPDIDAWSEGRTGG